MWLLEIREVKDLVDSTKPPQSIRNFINHAINSNFLFYAYTRSGLVSESSYKIILVKINRSLEAIKKDAIGIGILMNLMPRHTDSYDTYLITSDHGAADYSRKIMHDDFKDSDDPNMIVKRSLQQLAICENCNESVSLENIHYNYPSGHFLCDKCYASERE